MRTIAPKSKTPTPPKQPVGMVHSSNFLSGFGAMFVPKSHVASNRSFAPKAPALKLSNAPKGLIL